MSEFSSSRARGVLLWVLALVVMLAAASYQRLTGPTRALRTSIELADRTLRVRLPRSGITGTDRAVRVPAPAGVTAAELRWRRYPSRDEWHLVSMSLEDEQYVASVPSQPPAGKIEYEVALVLDGGRTIVLPTSDERPILRFKDPVPLLALLPHVIVMFVSMLFGVRAALAVLARRNETRWLVPATAVGLGVGGLVLGPIVQKHAFGAYWTGWPLGHDLTDDKTLAMWTVWVVAALVVLRVRDVQHRAVRTSVVVAALVMLAVYLVPHSLRGSQLDYQALDAGSRPEDAIRTGNAEGTP